MLVEANKLCVITYDLFSWTTIHKKMLHESKLCFNVSIEAQVRCLNQKFINQSKMLTSVKLMHACVTMEQRSHYLSLTFMLSSFKFVHDALYCLVPGFEKCVFFSPLFGKI